MKITVIGGGLAGCEAAWYAANAGAKVVLKEMKPNKYSPAHKANKLCELVCSNSLKADRLDSAGGLLKKEMEMFGSVVCAAAAQTRVPAGGALAVDREKFADLVTDMLSRHPNIEIVTEEVKQIPREGVVIVAAGPLVEGELAQDIKELTGDYFSFYDAAAPIVTRESIDMESAFLGARYGRGGDDYINCPMTREEYYDFYTALITAERAELHEGIENPRVFEGCMPVEIMAARGEETLLYGPLKPVGLYDPKTGKRPFAVVQLRQDNREGTLYSPVGFQTNLKWGEQKRVFSMIPALKNAEFARYGVMHRNSFINSPQLLEKDFSLKSNRNIFFAGQITGVEGYTESAMSGILAGINAVRRCKGEEEFILPRETMMGALTDYVTGGATGDFQPMNANFGIIPPLETRIKDKKERYTALAQRSLELLGKTKSFL